LPGHYVVLQEDSDGRVSEVFRERVDVSGFPQLERSSRWGGDGNRLERRLSARVVGDGGVVYETDVAAARWLRGEFAAVDGMPAQAVHLPAEARYYVLRVPASNAPTRLLVDRADGSKRTAFETTLEPAGPAQKASSGDVIPLIQSGNPGNRLDLLIVAEGYTADQRGKFQQDALAVANNFLALSPYRDYRGLINVTGLFLASAQPGADKPQCAETPGAPVVQVDTALDATFCTSGIRRLVSVSATKTLAAASAVPNWDHITVLVNDSEYGGSGGTIMVGTLNSSAVAILQHEFGHSFFKLADEYEAAFPGYPPCSDAPSSSMPCEMNVSDRTNPLKWTGWVDPATPIPTPTAMPDPREAGAWQGARYVSSGMYRQCHNGIMRTLASLYFCYVDGEAFVTTLYSSGWGVPSSGISHVEPGTASPAASSVTVGAGSTVGLQVVLAGPDSGLDVAWKVDGSIVKTEHLASGAIARFDYTALAGSHVVELAITDRSLLLLTPRTSSRQWQVTGSGMNSTARLANLSTRTRVMTGDDVMIAGFVLSGSTPKRVVVNVSGPSLASYGIANPLANPTLTLVRSSDNVVIGSNDDWQAQANPADVPAIQASGFQPNSSLEPALIATLAPGGYTAIVQGAGGATGVGLVGLFEVDHPEVPFVNMSTRGKVLTGDEVMIAGFVIQGDSAKTVVVNVAGPSLSGFGIASPLANPQLTLVRAADNAVIATNDDWQTQANPSDVTAINNSGFKPNHALEPAIIATLAPGAYTAIVSGVGGGTGTGLVGVFVAP
jgi:hypothetical protein